jgi:hypothetical protein
MVIFFCINVETHVFFPPKKKKVAIKLIKKEGDGSSSRINKVEREISVLKVQYQILKEDNIEY